MAEFPDTRTSLILSVADPRNVCAWEEFMRVYQPVVYRVARQHGLQHADAEELVQEAMLAVAGAVERWVPDQQKGRFRDWLFRIARNLAINFLTRPKHQVWGTGDSDMQRVLENECDSAAPISQMFEDEYRREIFRQVAPHVKNTVKETTWRAFWLSTIEELTASEVAAQLGISTGAVYIARSRVVARLKKEARRIEESHGNGEHQ